MPLLLLSCFYCQQLYAHTKPKISITVMSDTYQYVMGITKGRPVTEVKDFAGPHSQRGVAEFILVQKAIALGGMDIDFRIKQGNFDGRNFKMLLDGHLLISFDSIWLKQAQTQKDKVYISQPVIRKGEFWAGVFTSPKNTSALNIRTLSDFRRHSIVSSKNWPTDWHTLNSINPRQLIHESNWLSMAKLVSNQWIDLMLISFNKSQSFGYEGDEYKLIAVPGIKLILDDSRHFCVSRKHPLGAETFAALERGLSILRERGEIIRAYHQVGFFNEKVKDWKILNP